MKNLKLIFLLLLLISSVDVIQAQQATTTTGGSATGTGGSVTYSIGQVSYNTNIGATGTLTEGVQQPYEIFVITGIDETKDILLECSAFPNPATSTLILKIENYKIDNLAFQLYDLNGKLIQRNKVDGIQTAIPMNQLVPATYLLKITDTNKEIKTFKIIKN